MMQIFLSVRLQSISAEKDFMQKSTLGKGHG